MRDKGESMRVAIYARVSMRDQKTIPLQISDLTKYAELRQWTIASVYEEMMSGGKDTRPQYKEVLKAARQRKIDCVLVWKLDRWGRGTRELINSMYELEELGVGLVSLSESLDLTTSHGRAMAQMLAVFANFEREQINYRVRAGLEQAKKKGIILGRPKVIKDSVAVKAKELKALGYSHAKIGRELGIGSGTVYKMLGKSAHREGRPIGTTKPMESEISES